MLVSNCQRWRDRRDSYRPKGETIRTSAYSVETIATDNEAKAFVRRHHYSGSYPAARRRFGLYRGAQLVGVAVFSVPQNAATFRDLPGETADSVDLGRFVLLDDVEANGESWFLARCFAQLRAEGFVTVVSFSEPAARTSADGDVVFGGHVGTIYQACNATYLGRSKRETKRMLADGRVMPGRTLTKIRHRRRGYKAAVEELVSRYGAPQLGPGEDAIAWVADVMKRLTRPLVHPGNLKYAWALRKRDRRHLPDSLPYPKLVRGEA
jgi:hypothetical protein